MWDWYKDNNSEWILKMREEQLNEEKADDVMKEIEETQALTFKEAMGSSYKFEVDSDTITISGPVTITPGIVLGTDVEINGTVECNGKDYEIINWDVPEEEGSYSFDFGPIEIDFDPEARLWKFDLLDLLDEGKFAEKTAEKTAPRSLTNNFEDNRDPRLGTLAQKEEDYGF